MLTKSQLKKIEQMIRRRMLSFTHDLFGPKVLTRSEIRQLQQAGLLHHNVRNFTGDAHVLGKLVALANREEARGITFKRIMLLAQDLKPMSKTEEKAIEWASLHTGEYIKGLGEDMIKEVRSTAMRHSSSAIRAVQDEVIDAVANRKTVSELKTALFHAVDDKFRDWQRVASTEMTAAIQNGIYQAIREEHGPEQLVYKRPNTQACKHCKRVYLEDDGVTPIIFKLTDLENSNIGKKASEWGPTIGPVHPWCFTEGHSILTAKGEVPIESIAVGDLVVTHKGRYRRVTATSARPWVGDLVVVKVGEKTLKCTPEHPFYLGNEEWISASRLRQGDHLHQVVGSKIVTEKVNQKPSMARQIPELVGVLSKLSFGSVPVATMNLDGNLALRDSNVDVILVDSHQRSDNDVMAGKLFDKCLFKVREFLVGFHLFSTRQKHFKRSFASSPFLVGGLSPSHPLFYGGSFVAAEQSIAHRSGCDTHFFESHPYSSTSRSKLLGNLLNGLFVLKQLANKLFIKVSSERHRPSPFSKPIAIASISKQEHSGLVYNFAVEEDESYVCEGIVTHNCQCQLHILPEGFGFETSWVVTKPFTKDGKEYKVGSTISQQLYDSLSDSERAHTGHDAVLQYNGKAAEATTRKSLESRPISDFDNCICRY